jgi:hypothetical protein
MLWRRKMRAAERAAQAPCVVILVRIGDSDEWQRAVVTPFKHGDLVVGTFEALEDATVEFKSQIEAPGEEPYPCTVFGKESMTYDLKKGDTVTVDHGWLRWPPKPLSAGTGSGSRPASGDRADSLVSVNPVVCL